VTVSKNKISSQVFVLTASSLIDGFKTKMKTRFEIMRELELGRYKYQKQHRFRLLLFPTNHARPGH
jgi:hypothetical protein